MSTEVGELRASIPLPSGTTGGAGSAGAVCGTDAGAEPRIGDGGGISSDAAVEAVVSSGDSLNGKSDVAFRLAICLDLFAALAANSDSSMRFALVLNLAHPATVTPRTMTTVAPASQRVLPFRLEFVSVAGGAMSASASVGTVSPPPGSAGHTAGTGTGIESG